jgi:hypothetical protein
MAGILRQGGVVDGEYVAGPAGRHARRAMVTITGANDAR